MLLFKIDMSRFIFLISETIFERLAGTSCKLSRKSKLFKLNVLKDSWLKEKERKEQSVEEAMAKDRDSSLLLVRNAFDGFNPGIGETRGGCKKDRVRDGCQRRKSRIKGYFPRKLKSKANRL